ncbi:hypothetical protein AMATHDRAFT_48707 [Amanita thiersii Skay4041]|uniref:Uncharacterized protein n=1 Tax=Amanita thiersii Skay4041 TaxID=703135 RepID=A0A2A9NNZ3_9AGAR|nr:hypothetical protein AMATHDRAFT_48707 [Amanita thiersii Skay4041]
MDSETGLHDPREGEVENDPPLYRESDSDSDEEEVDLIQDFKDVIKRRYEISSRFAANFTSQDAPSPWLMIEGIGLVGLPLSERDAALVKARAIELFYTDIEQRAGKLEGVVGVWEIRARHIKFDNPHWESFVGSLIEEKLNADLGVPSQSLSCSLVKLVLCDAASQWVADLFTIHVLTKDRIPDYRSCSLDCDGDADGEVVNLLIFLPSRHTGGGIAISYMAETRTYDPSSFSGTTALAWCNVANLEVKPLTSGHRLALCYKVKHTVQCIPKLLPFVIKDVEDELQQIFVKWYNRGYDGTPLSHMVVLLQERYSNVDLDSGLVCLRNDDAYLVSLLHNIGRIFGYLVCFAAYELRLTGFTNFESQSPSLSQVTSIKSVINYMVDSEGNNLIPGTTLSVDSYDLISRHPLMNEHPGHVEFLSNSTDEWDNIPRPDSEHCYARNALVIFHQDDKDDVLFSAFGPTYILTRLAQFGLVDSPTAEERKIANLLLSGTSIITGVHQEAMLALASHAIRRSDLELWKKIMEHNGITIESIGTDTLLHGLEVFGFKSVQVVYQELLIRGGSLGLKRQFLLDVLHRASSLGDHSSLDVWIKEQTLKIIDTYDLGSLDDVSVIVTLAREGWARQLCSLGSSARRLDFGFARTLATALWLERQSIVSSLTQRPRCDAPNGDEEDRSQSCYAEVDTLIDILVECSIRESRYMLLTYPFSIVRGDNYIQRMVQLIELCSLTQRNNHCERVLSLAFNEEWKNQDIKRFRLILVTRLRDFIPRLKGNACWEPFSRFMQRLIGDYLTTVLGTKTRNPHVKKNYVFLCSCQFCKEVEEFMLQVYVPRHIFKAPPKALKHIRQTCGYILDDNCQLESTYSAGTIISILATKKPKVLKAARWEDRYKDAKQFLAGIGTDEEIRVLMGDKYDVMLRALEGEEQAAFWKELPPESSEDLLTDSCE